MSARHTKRHYPLKITIDGKFVQQHCGTPRLIYEGAQDMVTHLAYPARVEGLEVVVTDRFGAVVDGWWNEPEDFRYSVKSHTAALGWASLTVAGTTRELMTGIEANVAISRLGEYPTVVLYENGTEVRRIGSAQGDVFAANPSITWPEVVATISNDPPLS